LLIIIEKFAMHFYRILQFLNNVSIMLVVFTPNAQMKVKENGCTPNPIKPLTLSGPFSTCFDTVKESMLQRHPDQQKDTVNAISLLL